MEALKVLQVGMGPLGQKIVQYIGQREGAVVIGAVDIDPELTGRDLGEICGSGKTGVLVHRRVSDFMESRQTVRPDVVILTTVSNLELLVPQIEEIVSVGLPIVSTCEELCYPWNTAPAMAARIDQVCKKKEVAVVGTGVNPGFLMDALPAFFTSVCQKVSSVTVERIQDASSRRIPFQKKIGAGLSLEAFEQRKIAGVLRHVGLTESVHLIAGALGWQLSRTEDLITPVVAKEQIVTDAITIPKGHAAGVQQIGRGFVDGQERISLVFRAAIGEPDPHDTIDISGAPSFSSTIKGGVHGDVATCAITINAARRIGAAAPGLRSMMDLPMPSHFS